MLISTRGRYALRIMLELAQYDQSPYMPLPLIAEKQGISEKYLESIVKELVKAHVLEGVRGKPLPAKVEQWINVCGMALLLALMMFVTMQDVGRLL